MFSRWIVTNITSARGNLHCRKTRIPFLSTRHLWTVVTPISQRSFFISHLDSSHQRGTCKVTTQLTITFMFYEII
jgi:hypothetical protein